MAETIEHFTHEELRKITDKARGKSIIPHLDPTWARAYKDLEHAAIVVDLLMENLRLNADEAE